MANKLPPRFGGRAPSLARIALLMGLAAAIAAPRSSSARVSGLYCAPMAGPHDRITSAGGSWIELTPDQFAFVRGVWATVPESHGMLPLGRKAFLSRGGNEPADSIYFIDEEMICARMFVSQGLAQRIIDVGAGLIPHSGDAS